MKGDEEEDKIFLALQLKSLITSVTAPNHYNVSTRIVNVTRENYKKKSHQNLGEIQELFCTSGLYKV